MKKFSSILKQWRKSTGHTQESACKFLNVNLNTYRGWEQGKHEPSAGFKKAIIGWIGIDKF